MTETTPASPSPSDARDDFYAALGGLQDAPALIWCQPEQPDFTNPLTIATLTISTPQVEFDVPLKPGPELLIRAGWLRHYFSSGPVRVGWKLKGLFSFLRHHCGEVFDIDSRWHDLAICEWHNGVAEKRPTNVREAVRRLSAAIGTEGYRRFRQHHEPLYLDLAAHILPAMEVQGLVNLSSRRRVHPRFSIPGQEGGRLMCDAAFQCGINVHNLDPDQKAVTAPSLIDGVFVLMDVRHCELSVLGWLSGDPALLADASSGADLYDAAFTRLTGRPSTPKTRKFVKGTLLPIFYGLSAVALSSRMGCTHEFASSFVSLVRQRYAVAWSWLSSQQPMVAGPVVDHFGRSRWVDKPHIARNFVVQAPAALLCLSKLQQLHAGLGPGRLVSSVHDAFALQGLATEVQELEVAAREILESESPLAPGLSLKGSTVRSQSLSEKIPFAL